MTAAAGGARKRWRERARRIESAARELVGTSMTVDHVGGESSVRTRALLRLEWLLALNDAEKLFPNLPASARADLECAERCERFASFPTAEAVAQHLRWAPYTGQWLVSVSRDGAGFVVEIAVRGRAVLHVMRRADRVR